MNIEEKLDKLKKITPVEAPPFLYTRVQQRIDLLNQKPATVKWRLAFSFTALLVIVINIAVVMSSQRIKNNNVEQVVKAMQLSSSNEFYYE